jgi:CRP-like cAMP-binding protein
VGINKFDKKIQESIQSNFKKMKIAAKKKIVEQVPATPKSSVFEVVNTLRFKIDSPDINDIQESLDRMVPPDIDQRGTLIEVKALSAGASFGELALMDNRPRAATIICKEDSHFAVLEKQFFNQILSKTL